MHFDSIDERVEKIKQDEAEINRLVEEYKPFIAACTEKVIGRYVRYGEDDELSIALMAFVEAIASFDSLKGNFLSFARNVIHRRLVDYYRKEKKHGHLISIHGYGAEDGEEGVDLSAGESLSKYSEREIAENRRLELEELKKELSKWDISFAELAESSPKHDKTRKSYMDVIRYINSQPEMVSFIKTKKYLPIAEIEKALNIPRKTIERARKYIIAVLIVMNGDYQFVRDYVDWG